MKSVYKSLIKTLFHTSLVLLLGDSIISAADLTGYTVRYTCNGETYAPNTGYDVVEGEFVLRLTGPGSEMTGSVGKNGFIQMPSSRNNVHLWVTLHPRGRGVYLKATNVGIRPDGTGQLSAFAYVNDFGIKAIGEPFNLTSGSPQGWVGCVLTVVRN